MFQRELKTRFFLLSGQLTLCLMNIFFIGNDEQEFALALFEEEDKYSVVEQAEFKKSIMWSTRQYMFYGEWGNQLHLSVQS